MSYKKRIICKNDLTKGRFLSDVRSFLFLSIVFRDKLKIQCYNQITACSIFHGVKKGRDGMGHSEKLIYCEKCSDTKKLYELLLKYKKQLQIDEILTILIFKRNYNFRHRELLGFKINGVDAPFNYSSQFQQENIDHFYCKELTDEEYEKVSDENAVRELVYSEEREHLFSKGDMLIWLVGDSRGDMQDIYNIFGFGLASEMLMLSFKVDGELPEEYMKEGKIDYRAAAPVFGAVAAYQILPEEEVKILEEARVIDFDGVENPEKIIYDATLFKHKPLHIKCYREEIITLQE